MSDRTLVLYMDPMYLFNNSWDLHMLLGCYILSEIATSRKLCTTRCKSGTIHFWGRCQLIFDKIFPKNATFKLLAMSNDELNFFIHFCTLHIKNVWFLLELELALVTNHGHEICAGVIGHIWSNNRLLNEVGELCIANQAVIHGKEFIQNNACLLPFCTNHKLHLFLRRGPDFFLKLQYVLEWLFPM